MAQSAVLATASALPVHTFAQEKMMTRPIPGTDETLPVIGLGASASFRQMPAEGSGLPRSLIQAMLDNGGTVIDTPPFFRPDPPVLGQILNEMERQDDLFLTAKITVNGKEEGIQHLETSVQNLNKDPIDLLMVHNMRNLKAHWATLKEWKDAGRTRYIGVSLTHQETYYDLEKFMQAEMPDFILTGYSILHIEAAQRALPLAADLGIAVIAAQVFRAGYDDTFFNLVAGKKLPEWAAEFDCNSWAQFALKYALGNPAMTCIVTETSKPHHVVDNMGAGYGRLPNQFTRDNMRDYVLSL
jgi:diketogulonate reductase-like aldo/keto reductase